MISRKYFQFSKTDKILIYGAGGLGQEFCSKLSTAGYNMQGFIDKNAASMNEVCCLPVYTADEASKTYNGSDCIVIICLHNALWHSEPAQQLYEKGFENIILLPIGSEYNIREKSRMEYIYDTLRDGAYENAKDIPMYRTLTEISYSPEDGVIEKNDKMVTVWMEIASIFSNDVLKERGNDITKQYGDLSVTTLKPYIEMYKYCEDGNGDIALYCRAFKGVQNAVDDITTNEFINDRIELYDLLKQELNAGMKYFIQAAPVLKWNHELKHFNVHEGHHRLIFLWSQGLNMAPVKISIADFNIWANEQVYQECLSCMETNDIKKWITPVNHPGLYYLPAKRKNIYSVVLGKVQNMLGACPVNGMQAVDFSETGGYFARALKSMGCSTVICNAHNKKTASFTSALNKLAYFEDIEIINGTITDAVNQIEKANIGVFQLSGIDEASGMRLFKMLDAKISDYAVVECPASWDISNCMENSHFGYKTYIKKHVAPEGITDFWLLSVKNIKE